MALMSRIEGQQVIVQFTMCEWVSDVYSYSECYSNIQFIGSKPVIVCLIMDRGL